MTDFVYIVAVEAFNNIFNQNCQATRNSVIERLVFSPPRILLIAELVHLSSVEGVV